MVSALTMIPWFPSFVVAYVYILDAPPDKIVKTGEHSPPGFIGYPGVGLFLYGGILSPFSRSSLLLFLDV